jgi:hypothetical protein
MAHRKGPPSHSALLRWTSFIVVLANVAFIVDYATLSSATPVAEVVAKYGNAFVPKFFAQGLGGLVVAALALFALYALWPRRRRRAVIYDRLVVPLALTSTLASAWLVAYRHEWIALSTALVAAMMILAGVMFVRVTRVAPGAHSRWLRVPFALLFGALTIALLVAITQWLRAEGVPAALMREDASVAFLIFAVAVGGMVALCYTDIVYPFVMALAIGAIFVANPAEHPLASYALVAGVGMLLITGLAGIADVWQPEPDLGKTTRRRLRVADNDAPDPDWLLLEPTTSMHPR